jgi:uncharacterized membrane protein/protein-disulfide isomerase
MVKKRLMTPRTRWLILGFSLLGLTFAAESTWVHYRLLTDPTYVSPCDISSTVNCTQAYLSRFGTMFGVPVAIGGAAWFALVALIAAFARPDKPGTPLSSPVGGYVFALATVGLAAVLYLAYASWFVIHTYCLLCMGSYASVIGIFIVSGLSASMGMGQIPRRAVEDLRAVFRKPLTLLAALLYIAATASCVVFFPHEMRAASAPPAAPPVSQQEQFAKAWEAQPRVNLGIPSGTAKVVVVKFNDWLCPMCKGMALAYQPVLDKYAKSDPGAVKVVIKDWPWNAACNQSGPNASIPGHEGACDAVVAVRLARDRGKADEMIDWLFSAQQELTELGVSGKGAKASQMIRDKAAEMLGVKDFDHESSAKLVEVRRDVADGMALGVHSTPTFFINGVRIPEGQTLAPEFFDLAIQLELKKNGGKQ